MFLEFLLNLLFCTFLGFVYALPPYIHDEGSRCITSEGLAGICIEINYCPSAVKDLRDQKELPDVCDFNNDKIPIVCCVKLRKSIEQCMITRENRNFQPFIINGSESKKGEFRHMAHIGYLEKNEPEYRTTYACGASLISNRFLLTAAHCEWRGRKVAVNVRLGTLKNPSNKDPEFLKEGVNMKIDKFIAHPNYFTDGKRSFNDIALLRLREEVKFTNLIQPACLYIKHDINRMLIATGWGLTSNTKVDQSPVLMQIHLKTEADKSCNKFIPSAYLDDRYKFNIICLVGETKDKDTCKGDSGGPVQIRERLDQTVYSVVGITGSGSDPCSGPGIYTRVAAYVDWIEDVVWQ